MISMILAINNTCSIGKDNKLMYRLKDDMIHFKTMTSGDTVVMGRKTFESLKGPLPNRTNIVITSNPSCITHPGVITISPEDFKNNFLPQHSDPSCTTNVWIIGGGQVYETATPYASQIYCTFVDDDEEGDVKLPAGIFGAFVQLLAIKSVDVDEDNDKPYDIVHMVRRDLINTANPVGEKLASSTMPGFTFGEEYDELVKHD